MTAGKIEPRTLVAVLVAFAAALFARTVLQLRLMDADYDRVVAGEWSYLVVPPVMAMLLFPLFRKELPFVLSRFRRQDLTIRLIVHAIAIGILFRALYWCALTAKASFIAIPPNKPNALAGPVFGFECVPTTQLILAFAVTATLIPLIEEIVHRGYLQTSLHVRGPVIAVTLSTILFALLHRTGSIPYAFAGGLIMGTLYWRNRSLWAPFVVHCTANGLSILDWRCFRVVWRPAADDIPFVTSGVSAMMIGILCVTGIAWLVFRDNHGAKHCSVASR